MATWQFDLSLAPKQSLIGFDFDDPMSVQEAARDRLVDLSCLALGRKAVSKYLAGLHREDSWSKDLEIWGNMESNRIDILFDKENIESIRIRIDLRKVDRNFLVNIVNLAECNNCVFINTDMGLIKPSLEELIEKIMKSNQIKFIENPHEFLDNILNSKRLM